MNPLIEVSELQQLLASDHPPAIVDVRYRLGGPPGEVEYLAGHVPQAVFVDLDSDLAAAPGRGGRHPLPSAEVFGEAMRRCGVDNGREVVVYDDWSSHAAARCWWLLRFYGHQRVRVLDGGWQAWRAAGAAIDTGDYTPSGGDFLARPGGLPTIDSEEVPKVDLLIDARAPERFRGEVEPVDPVAGHIPGARNVPTSANVTPDGRFLDADSLTALYEAVGADQAEQIAVYCGSGVTACHDILALELAGRRAALYPGSWSGWITDSARPVAVGE